MADIRACRDMLVDAPTGSGETLTAFVAALDDLVVLGLAPGGLPDETAVVYVSPLSDDIRLDLDAPLDGIRAELAALGLPDRHPRGGAHGRHAAAGAEQRLRRPLHTPFLPIKLRSRPSATPSYGPRTAPAGGSAIN